MLTLFKGELSYEEFTRKMTYKEMIALRDARVDQLIEEKKRNDEEFKQQERESIRNNILSV